MNTNNLNKNEKIFNDFENKEQSGLQYELIVEINGFFEENLTIKEAKKYEVKLKDSLNFDYISKIFSCTRNMSLINKQENIIINGLSFRDNGIVKKYIQQNCLILSLNTVFLHNSLTVKENIQIISLLFTGFDLSKATISSFAMQELENKKINSLSEEQKKLIILSLCVCCPAIIWIIDYNLLTNLSNESLELWDNAVKIRIKHGGVVLVIQNVQ